MNDFHTSVLLHESVNGLMIDPNGIYVDSTFGGGGHAKSILNKLKHGKLIAFEQDKAALKNSIRDDKRFTMVNKNFRYLKQQLELLGIYNIDGLIADLGVSAYHFTDNNRGFSLKYNASIDMRMDTDIDQNGAHVLNTYSRKGLNRIFREHADFKNPKFIVDSIIKARVQKPINTTFELKALFDQEIYFENQNKFFARVFQAIRIEVNDELSALKALLQQCLDVIKPSGRLVVISYHSIEDRLVKSFMKFGNFSNSLNKDFFGNASRPFRLINKKPITPSIAELKSNNKSRSAKLRICEKI